MNDYFLKIPVDELSSKFSRLVESKGEVKFWGEDLNFFKGHMVSFGPRELKVESSSIYSGSQIECFSFQQDSFVYYGKILRFIYEKDIVRFFLDDFLFRTEKRTSPRLLTYPHFKAFAYFFGPVEGSVQQDNVVSINRMKNQGIDEKFKQFSRNILNGEEVFGLQVIDLASDGLSLLANSHEVELLENLSINEFNLHFESHYYPLTMKEVSYRIDFVSPKAPELKLKKVGLQIQSGHEYREKIDQLLSDQIVLTQDDIDFLQKVKSK